MRLIWEKVCERVRSRLWRRQAKKTRQELGVNDPFFPRFLLLQSPPRFPRFVFVFWRKKGNDPFLAVLTPPIPATVRSGAKNGPLGDFVSSVRLYPFQGSPRLGVA